MATDSYFVSNEAMAKDRHADLLAWLIGPDKNVVFDEAHFGIVETSGVAVLMRKYRLHGLAAGLMLLAGLFIWKNSTSLVPPLTDEKQGRFCRRERFAARLREFAAPQHYAARSAGDLFRRMEKICGAKADNIPSPGGNRPRPFFSLKIPAEQRQQSGWNIPENFRSPRNSKTKNYEHRTTQGSPRASAE